MDKVDVIFFIPLAYMLRTTLIFATLARRFTSSTTRYVYDYWFNPFDNEFLRSDISVWFLFFLKGFILLSLYAFNNALKIQMWLFQVILIYLQRIPGTSIILFWPKFYKDILLGPGRSIAEMRWNPHYENDVTQPARTTRRTRRRLLQRGLVKIQPTHARYYLHSDYQVEGAWSHLAIPGNERLLESAHD